MVPQRHLNTHIVVGAPVGGGGLRHVARRGPSGVGGPQEARHQGQGAVRWQHRTGGQNGWRGGMAHGMEGDFLSKDERRKDGEIERLCRQTC